MFQVPGDNEKNGNVVWECNKVGEESLILRRILIDCYGREIEFAI